MLSDDGDIDAGPDDAQDDEFDLSAIIGDSNNGAYQRVELRTGPPLAYVAEKLRAALEQIHGAHRSMAAGGDERRAAQAAFHYCLVAYLALNNMLSLAGDHGVVERLLAMSREELGRWLEAVAAEGSVTG